MKDYLSKDERVQLLFLKKYIDAIDKILEEWETRNNLSKEEIKLLKTGKTWGLKAFNSIVKRLNKSASKTLLNSIKSSYINVHDKYAIDIYRRKITSKLNDCYEINKDYYKLVELVFFYNCRNCKKHCTDCEIYKEFEEHCIPEIKENNIENCKYAYEEQTFKDMKTIEKLKKLSPEKLEEVKRKIKDKRGA